MVICIEFFRKTLREFYGTFWRIFLAFFGNLNGEFWKFLNGILWEIFRKISGEYYGADFFKQKVADPCLVELLQMEKLVCSPEKVYQQVYLKNCTDKMCDINPSDGTFFNKNAIVIEN